jgi:hypothetical protein
MVARNNELTQQALKEVAEMRQEMNHGFQQVNSRLERVEERMDGLSTRVRLVNRYASDLRLDVDELKGERA